MLAGRHVVWPWLIGSDAGVRRLLRYWAVGLLLYLSSLVMLWFEVWLGVAPRVPVLWLTAASLAGAGLAFVMILAKSRLGLSGATLSAMQGFFAITCIIAAYALVGPVRGVSLCILVVVLVFNGFSATSMQTRAMCGYAIVLLGSTMLWKTGSDAARYPVHEEVTHFVVASTMLVAVAYLAEQLSRLRSALKERAGALASALERIREMAQRDELTQLFNRRHMAEVLGQEFMRNKRNVESPCVAVLDIDHFKRINDTLGHAAGDQILRCFASEVLAAVRGSDTLARWGGEEFLLLLPGTRLDGATDLLERIRIRVRETVRADSEPQRLITFSAGLAEWAPGESVDAVIERADAALYRAKETGRDRIASAGSAAETPARDAATA